MVYSPQRNSGQSKKVDPRELAGRMGRAVLKTFAPGGLIKDRSRRDAADTISNELYVSMQENLEYEVEVLGAPALIGNVATIRVRLRDRQGNPGVRKQLVHVIVEDDGEWDPAEEVVRRQR